MMALKMGKHVYCEKPLTHTVYESRRIAEAARESRPGQIGLPRWDDAGQVVIDWMAEDDLEPVDPRMVRCRHDGSLRLTFTSHLRVARSADGKCIDSVDQVRFLPEGPHESFGVEDPRITRLDNVCYFTYVAVSPHGAATALASTTDFVNFHRHGVILGLSGSWCKRPPSS